jgi:uncharacterized damage-inducible protein DinB
MTRIAIETLVWMTYQAFDGDSDQSLIASIHDVRDQDWEMIPPNGGRSIADILEHVAWAKWMYQDYAFSNGTLRGDVPPLIPSEGAQSRPIDELLDWLREGHELWLSSVMSLEDDEELDLLRGTNWGTKLPIRDLVEILIAHDFYHAGEINHLRALIQQTDRWPY